MPLIKTRSVVIEVPDRVLLENVDISIEASTITAIMGPSGSGKSTLLNCLCGITLPKAGDILVNGKNLREMSSSQRADFRLHNIGVVFQFGELLPELTVLENVSLPLRLQGKSASFARSEAHHLLKLIGLPDLADSYPATLSGGEIQRVAVARAAITRPALILADEPTGSLDEVNGQVVTELLASVARQLKSAVVTVTHNSAIADRADKSFVITQQRLIPRAT